MTQLSIKIPTNVEIIKKHHDNGTWPDNAIAIELKTGNRWFMAVPHQGAWDTMLIEPNSDWRRNIKHGMTNKETTSLVNAILRNKSLYKDNSRSAHVSLIKSLIKTI
jgi:hypothetical protein